MQRATKIGEVKKLIADGRGGDVKQWRFYQLFYGTQLLQNSATVAKCGRNRSVTLSLLIVGEGVSESDSDTGGSNGVPSGSSHSSSSFLTRSDNLFFSWLALSIQARRGRRCHVSTKVKISGVEDCD